MVNLLLSVKKLRHIISDSLLMAANQRMEIATTIAHHKVKASKPLRVGTMVVTWQLGALGSLWSGV